MNRRHQPLDPEERALAELLASGRAAEPSPELDARILAAARAPVRPAAPASSAPGRRRRRWPVALGLAASVTLAVGVAWQLREPPMPAVAPASAPLAETMNGLAAGESADTADTAAAPPPATEGESAPAAAASPPATGAEPSAEHRAAVAAAAERSSQRQEKALRQTEAQLAAEAEQARERQAAVAAATQRSTQRAEKAARQAAAPLPPPPPEPVPDIAEPRPTDAYQAPPPAPPAPVADRAFPAAAPPAQAARARAADARSATESAATFEERIMAPAPADAKAIEDDARLPPAEWLQRIREHRDRGETELAQASLARFVRTHPDVPVPADLRPLAP